MLRLIVGQSGSGKTTRIYNKIEECVKNGQDAVFIVPEQFTLESERRILEKLGNRLAGKVEVLSFLRLSHYVFKEAGGPVNPYVDAGGRLIVMSKVMDMLSDRLKVYSKMRTRPEFLKKMSNIITELKMYNISEKSLESAANKANHSTTKDKLNEIMLIYSAYNAEIALNYSDSKDDLICVSEILKSNSIFKEKIIFMDGFNGFTEGEYEIIKQLITQSEIIYITLRIPADGRDSEAMFDYVNKTMNSLKRIAVNANVKIDKTEHCEDTYYNSKELTHMEKYLFEMQPPQYKEPINAVKILKCAKIYDECEAVCENIRELTSEGYKYKEIAIIVRDIEKYKGFLEIALKKSSISFFMDIRTPLQSKTLPAFIFAACELLYDNFRTDTVFNYLKFGFTDLTVCETGELEHYARLWNINGAQWMSEFIMHPEGYDGAIEEAYDEDERKREKNKEKLRQLNDIRLKFIEPLLRFKENAATEKTALSLTRSIYALLTDLKIEQKLKKIKKAKQAQNEIAAADETDQLWEILIKVFDQIVYILKDSSIDIKKYTELLKLTVSQYKIGKIPSYLDTVTVGNADRTRLNETKCVIIMGMNEGTFPQKTKDQSLLTQKERSFLKENEIELSMTEDEKAAMENYYIYSILSSATDRLIMLYSHSELTGTALQESGILKSIKKMLPNMAEISYKKSVQNKYDLFEQTLLSGSEKLIESIQDYSDLFDEFNDLKLKIEKEQSDTEIKKETAEKLYQGKTNYISPSQLETYISCKFRYACQYTMRLSREKSNAFSASNTGNLIHKVLEEFTKLASAKEYALNESEITQSVTEVMEKIVSSINRDKDSGKRVSRSFNRMKTGLIYLCENLCDEFKQSEFKTVGIEQSLGNENGESVSFKTTNGEFTLTGKADRIDSYKDGNKCYLRIVDYKTGTQKFSIKDVQAGYSMQMFVYMMSMLNKNLANEINIPAGVTYVPAAKPQIKLAGKLKGSELTDKVKEMAYKSFRRNGMINSDAAVLEAMEKTPGTFLPLKANKEGGYKSTSSLVLANESEIQELHGTIHKNIENIVSSIGSGEAKAEPTKKPTANCLPCKYCDFYAVCRKN